MSDDGKIYRRHIRRRRNLEPLIGILAWCTTSVSLIVGNGVVLLHTSWLPHWSTAVVIPVSLALGSLSGLGAVRLVRLFHRSQWPESPDEE